MKDKRAGWRNEPVRHGLAAQGIETSLKKRAEGKKSVLTQAKVNFLIENRDIEENDFWGTEAEKWFEEGFKDYPRGKMIDEDLFDYIDRDTSKLTDKEFHFYMAGIEEGQLMKSGATKSQGMPEASEVYEGKKAREKASDLLTTSTWRGEDEPNPKDVKKVVVWDDEEIEVRTEDSYYMVE